MASLALLTRPEAEAASFAETIRAEGWEAVNWPLFRIVSRLSAPPDPGDAEAFVFTSARGVEALAAFGAPPPLPAWCVGPATAAAARAAGFAEVEDAAGNAAALTERLLAAPPLRVLHVRGAQAAGDLAGALRAAGREARELIAYGTAPGGPPPEPVEAAMRAGRVRAALFFSPRAARRFAEAAPDAWRAAYPAAAAIAISAATMAPLEALEFGRRIVAARPDGAAMRAALAASA